MKAGKPPRTPNQLYNRAIKVSEEKSSTFYPVLPIVPIEQQRPSDCLLVAILMCIRYYGVVGNEQQMLDSYRDHYSDEEGSSYEDAFKFLKLQGFKPKWAATDLESLKEYKREGIPVLYDFRLTNDVGHCVVFCGFDDKWVYFSDPGVGFYVKMPSEMFEDKMVPVSAAAIAVYPTDNIKPSIVQLIASLLRLPFPKEGLYGCLHNISNSESCAGIEE